MDKALKQRLVGASVLIALAVIVLPMLLSGQPDGQQETRSIEVPPKPSELSFETRRFPVGQAGTSESVRETENQLDTLKPDPIPAPVKVEPNAGPVPDGNRPQSAPDRNAVENEGSTDSGESGEVQGRYLVQVASFSTVENTNNLSNRLKEDGLPVLLDTIEADAGVLHRVRVGPFDELSAANAALETIQGRTPDLEPRIIDLRPEVGAPVTEPSDPLVRWVVQAGSFAERDNADSLEFDLKEQGYPAYTVVVTETSGVRYKVRIGPMIERQAAVDMATELGEKLNLDGIVMSVE